jgi:hypothetical protein
MAKVRKRKKSRRKPRLGLALGKIVSLTLPPPAGELAFGKYVLRARAFDAQGDPTRWSGNLAFTLTLALATPTLTGPSGIIYNPRPTFRWNPVAGADHYQIVITDITDPAHPLMVLDAANATGTSWLAAASLTVNHHYSWTVRAFDSQGNPSLWSNARFHAAGGGLLTHSPEGGVWLESRLQPAWYVRTA